MTPLNRRRLIRLAGVAVACVLVWHGLGMHRGLLLSADIKSRFWPWAPNMEHTQLQAPALSDPVWQFVPWLRFARRELAAGRVPLWNPHQDGGVPFLANPQTALTSPMTWPCLALGIEHGWNLSLLLRILIAGNGTFLLLHHRGRSPTAALLGGLVFALAAPFVAWLEHPHTMVVAWLPWLLLAIDRMLRRATAAAAAAVAGTTLLVLTGGFPPLQLKVALLAGSFLVVEGGLGRRSLRVVGAALLGVCLAGPLLLSFLEYLRLSVAATGHLREGFTNTPSALARLVLPHASVGHPIEAAAFVSLTALVLCAAALPRMGRARELRFWAAVAVAVAAVAYANPFSRWLADHTLIHWTRALLLWPLAAAFWAAHGLDAVRGRLERTGRRRVALGVATVAVALVGGELLWAARGVHAVTDPDVAPRSTPLLDMLAADPGIFRVLPLHRFLPPESATAVGLDDVRGYDALAPREWRNRRATLGAFGVVPAVTDALEPWDLARGGRALDDWNVKYLLMAPHIGFDADVWSRTADLRLEEIYAGPDGRILRNLRVRPRVRLGGDGAVAVAERTPTRWRLRVTTTDATELVVADPWFPGWRLELDGERVPLDLHPGDMISARIPPGRHQVEVRYAPASLHIGLALAAASLALLAAWGLRLRDRADVPTDGKMLTGTPAGRPR